MRLETRGCLADILRAAEFIGSAVADLSIEDYQGNWEKQSAVERQFLVIGEALVRIRDLEPVVFEKIAEGHKLIGLRNLLAHGYDAVDSDAIYRFTQEPLSELASVVASLLT